MHAWFRFGSTREPAGERDPFEDSPAATNTTTSGADNTPPFQSTVRGPTPDARRFWAGRAISGIACVPFLFGITVTLFPKLTPVMVNELAELGVPPHLRAVLIGLMVLCVATYLTPRTSVLGAILFTGYMGGAILAHLRIGGAPVFQIIVPTLAWIGAYLREPRLASLLPIRRG